MYLLLLIQCLKYTQCMLQRSAVTIFDHLNVAEYCLPFLCLINQIMFNCSNLEDQKNEAGKKKSSSFTKLLVQENS